MPPGLTMLSTMVDVRRLVSDRVTDTGRPGDAGACHEQNLLVKTPPSVLGSTQVNLMPRSASDGQHVTVVTEAMPAVSWHAL